MRKQTKNTLNKIMNNCEYLSQIQHRNQYNKTNGEWYPNGKELCTISTTKLLVQLSYLLYTCSLLKVNVFISTKPIYSRKSQSHLLEPKILFYLSEQGIQDRQENYNSQHEDSLAYIQMKACKFNQNIVQIIPKFYSQFVSHLAQKPPEQMILKINLKKSIETIVKSIDPKVMDNPDYPAIKQLQFTQMFLRCSDTLMAYRSSLFYQIKKNQAILNEIKKAKKNVASKLIYNISSPVFIYKEIDRFLMHFISSQILHMQKSSTREEKSNGNYLVGYVNKQTENGKQFEKYFARFYTFDKVFSENNSSSNERTVQQFKNVEKNVYILEYNMEASVMYLRYVTFLEANSETVDIISSYCSNIAFQDSRISFQTIDTIRNPTRTVSTKKYVAFKAEFRLYKTEQPFTKLLILMEYITVCAKIYVQIIIKKPNKDQTLVIREYMNRLDHLIKLFVDKAEFFYKNI